MKYTIIFLLLISLSSYGQPASIDSAITLTCTKQTLWIYGYFQSQNANWDSRKLPDDVVAVIGSNKTSPDSVITFTFRRGKQLANFIQSLQGDRIGAFLDFYRKIYLGNPAIGGFTSLKSQLQTLSANNTQQGRTALEVRQRVNNYGDALDALFVDCENRGIDWIKN